MLSEGDVNKTSAFFIDKGPDSVSQETNTLNCNVKLLIKII